MRIESQCSGSSRKKLSKSSSGLWKEANYPGVSTHWTNLRYLIFLQVPALLKKIAPLLLQPPGEVTTRLSGSQELLQRLLKCTQGELLELMTPPRTRKWKPSWPWATPPVTAIPSFPQVWERGRRVPPEEIQEWEVAGSQEKLWVTRDVHPGGWRGALPAPVCRECQRCAQEVTQHPDPDPTSSLGICSWWWADDYFVSYQTA